MRIRCLFLGLVALIDAVAAQAAGKLLIVADEWPQMEVLGAYLAEKGGHDVEKVEQTALPKSLSAYEGVFQFVHGRLDDATAEALMAYAKGGGRLIVLHHGISSKKAETKDWMPFLGVVLDRGEDAQYRYSYIHGVRLTLVNLNPEHFITSHGVEYATTVAYMPSDQPSVAAVLPAIELEHTEVFLNHQFTDARAKTVLLGFRYADSGSGEVYMQDRAGWFKPTGNGYTFYFQLGHEVSDFQNANYCQIILNCLAWKPDGSGGADADE
ncbi:MAG TPA: ThuA domain-containing protein [Candidatus Hydrogenedentes bacterium]|nr:ThuA domain-containing protein [Candidatus Hydrogenedentota bacterium]HPG67039.1 ThuA domain-containing protein [Candidatus Hydrogenedentota bacterium]